MSIAVKIGKAIRNGARDVELAVAGHRAEHLEQPLDRPRPGGRADQRRRLFVLGRVRSARARPGCPARRAARRARRSSLRATSLGRRTGLSSATAPRTATVSSTCCSSRSQFRFHGRASGGPIGAAARCRGATASSISFASARIVAASRDGSRIGSASSGTLISPVRSATATITLRPGRSATSATHSAWTCPDHVGRHGVETHVDPRLPKLLDVLQPQVVPDGDLLQLVVQRGQVIAPFGRAALDVEHLAGRLGRRDLGLRAARLDCRKARAAPT